MSRSSTDRIFTVEIFGENNSFTIEATVDYEPCEDWLTGKVTYVTCVDKAYLVHGSRRREVTNLLTDEQRKQITDKINRIHLAEYEEHLIDQAESAMEDRHYNTIGCANIGVAL